MTDVATPTATNSSSRFVGFDLLRLLSFFAITLYHFQYSVWHDHAPEFERVMPKDPFFWNAVYPFMHALCFSGFTIVFMSAVLIALARKRLSQIARFCLFLFLAWLSFVWAENDFSGLAPFWDVHLLVLVGFLTIACIEKLSPRLVIVCGLIGFAGTWITFWNIDFFQHLSLGLRSSLVGDCVAGVSSWPILPWLGFLWSGYALGFWLRQPNSRAAWSRWMRLEPFAWAAVLGLTVFKWGAFYRIQLADWECSVYHVPPLEFWAHMIWIVFAIRLSFLTSVNTWLSTQLPWLRKLHVSKNFFLAYALQYVFGFALAIGFGDYFRGHPIAFTWTALAMLPSAELLARTATILGGRKVFKGSSNRDIAN
jgi:hypothetical protein